MNKPLFPEELTKPLLAQFPSTLKEEDLNISYDEWARREIDRRIPELTSGDAKVRWIAVSNIVTLSGRFFEGFPEGETRENFLHDKAVRDKIAAKIEAWWATARPTFKTQGKLKFENQ